MLTIIWHSIVFGARQHLTSDPIIPAYPSTPKAKAQKQTLDRRHITSPLPIKILDIPSFDSNAPITSDKFVFCYQRQQEQSIMMNVIPFIDQILTVLSMPQLAIR